MPTKSLLGKKWPEVSAVVFFFACPALVFCAPHCNPDYYPTITVACRAKFKKKKKTEACARDDGDLKMGNFPSSSEEITLQIQTTERGPTLISFGIGGKSFLSKR